MRSVFIKKDFGNLAMLFAFSVMLVFALNFLSAVTLIGVSKSNVTSTDAALCLNESVQIMAEMADSGLNVIRINDSIKEAQTLYDAQIVLRDRKRNYDFSLIIPYCDSIKKIKVDSITATDEFAALLLFYNESIVPGMNTTTIDKLVAEAQSEIISERYELVSGIVERAYSEIINVQSSYTTLNIFIDSTTKGLMKFIVDNWKVILTLLIMGALFFIAYRVKILKWITERRINKLQVRKNTLKNLIMKTQKDYFQLGKIAEGEYNIKTKKFADFVRDIDRQIPLLQEELIKLERKSKAPRAGLFEKLDNGREVIRKSKPIKKMSKHVKLVQHHKSHVKTKKVQKSKKKKY